MSVDRSFVDREYTALTRVCRVEVVNFEATASFGPQSFQRLLPFGIGGPFRWCVSGGQDSVLVVVALLDNCANFLLKKSAC